MAELSLRSGALPAPGAQTCRWTGNCSLHSLHQRQPLAVIIPLSSAIMRQDQKLNMRIMV